MAKPELHAIIGVIHQGSTTFYVKRSNAIEAYPGVWSLLSVRASREELRDFLDLMQIQQCVDRMSSERLVSTPLTVKRFITSAQCDKQDHRLYLYMYELESPVVPKLNPKYYSDFRFMDPAEYEQLSKDLMCGLCVSMWSRYCVKYGLTDRLFAEVPDLSPEGELYA